ncbi:MAG: AAA family ATPase [Acidobacteriaceae bacterium]
MLQRMLSMCYKRIMREWVREKLMRRRKKPVTNDSESTGKIGHEIPQDQPTPLQPSYPPSLEHGERTNETARAKPSDLASVERDRPGNVPPVAAADEKDRPARGEGRTSSRNQGRNSGRGHGRNRGRSQTAASASTQLDIPAANPAEPTLVHETQPESLATPPAELLAAPSPKGYVVLTIGLPGSGKTTWFKRRGVTPLSSDMLRSILFDDITEQRYQGLVFSTLRSLLRARLIAKMPWNYVDATNLSPHERRQWIKMARSFGYEVHAVFFDVPFEICMERNTRRDYMVNEAAMRIMQERLRPPSFQEGFHKITVVRVKNSPAAPAEEFDPSA